eukprot:gene12059-14747_t
MHPSYLTSRPTPPPPPQSIAATSINNADPTEMTSNSSGNLHNHNHPIPIKFKSIAEIFHYEMILFGRIRSPKHYLHYKSILEAFLIFYSNSWEEENEPILRIAMDLYKFLNTHSADPENILIGMTPSKDIQRRVKKYFYISEKENKNFRKFKGKWDLRISRPSLIENIISWSLIENKDLLMKTVREFSKHLEKERLHEGDILIVKLPKNWNPEESDTITDGNHHEFDEGSFILARYYKEADPLGLSCFIYLQPDEIKPIKIPMSRVVSLEMMDIMIPTDKSKLEKLITNPFDAFATEIRNSVKETTKYYLTEIGFNVNLIGQGLRFNGVKSAGFEDLHTVKKNLSTLENQSPGFLDEIDLLTQHYSLVFAQYLKEVFVNESRGNHKMYFGRDRPSAYTIPPNLLSELNHQFPDYNNTGFYKSLQQQEFDNCPTNQYFTIIKNQYIKFKPYLPTIRILINDLENGKKFCINAKDSLRGLVSECDLAIDTILTHNTKILDGSKKKELTNWYLQHIRDTVDSYLRDRGFDANAVPENYIDQPPESISKVRENLRIVNLVLNPTSHRQFEERLKNLFNPLKIKIYEGVDEFLSSAEILLSDKIKENKNLFLESSNDIENLDLKSILLYLKNLTFVSAPSSILNNQILNLPSSNSNSSTPQNNNSPSSSSSPLLTTTTTTPIGGLLSSDLQLTISTLSNLIEDILYIREMKLLEEKYYCEEILLESTTLTNEKQSLSNIVPITGLVFSRLLRLKHELRTVLEVWENKDRFSGTNFTLSKGSIPHHGVIIGKKDEQYSFSISSNNGSGGGLNSSGSYNTINNNNN